jgi:hypothetical protein
LTLHDSGVANEICTAVVVPVKDSKVQFLDNIRGNTIIRAVKLIDPVDNQRKIFFIFADLAIKTQGSYKLVATLIDISKYI